MGNIQFTFKPKRGDEVEIKIRAANMQDAIRMLEKEKKSRGIKDKMICIAFARNPAKEDYQQKEL